MNIFSCSSFCSETDGVTNRFSATITHKIKNVSENIGVMLLKKVRQNDANCAVVMATTLLPSLFHA